MSARSRWLLIWRPSKRSVPIISPREPRGRRIGKGGEGKHDPGSRARLSARKRSRKIKRGDDLTPCLSPILMLHSALTPASRYTLTLFLDTTKRRLPAIISVFPQIYELIISCCLPYNGCIYIQGSPKKSGARRHALGPLRAAFVGGHQCVMWCDSVQASAQFHRVPRLLANLPT